MECLFCRIVAGTLPGFVVLDTGPAVVEAYRARLATALVG